MTQKELNIRLIKCLEVAIGKNAVDEILEREPQPPQDAAEDTAAKAE